MAAYEDLFWRVFEKSGSIDAYMGYSLKSHQSDGKPFPSSSSQQGPGL